MRWVLATDAGVKVEPALVFREAVMLMNTNGRGGAAEVFMTAMRNLYGPLFHFPNALIGLHRPPCAPVPFGARIGC